MTLTLQDNWGCPPRLYFPLQQWIGKRMKRRKIGGGREGERARERESERNERNRRTGRERSSLVPGGQEFNETYSYNTLLLM